jgi:hypothetical protein
MNDCQKYTLCAISFFRSRWQKRPVYKKTKRKQQYVTNHARSCYMARYYIRKARQART